MRTIQRYGWRPSLPDHRDKIADPSGLSVADEVDPRSLMPDVFDQGQLGSCTANAVAAAYEFDKIMDDSAWFPHRQRPSRLFIYYCERMIEGSLGQGDTGAFGRDGFKALQKYGTPWEYQWRYDITKFQNDPPQPVWAAAGRHLLTKSYAAVPQDEATVKAILSNQQTLAFGFTVYESFESAAVSASGIVPMPSAYESQLGGHEVLAIGYLKDYPSHVLCRNSWGAGWGIKGYFLMPWQYLLSPSLASDLRTIVRPTT